MPDVQGIMSGGIILVEDIDAAYTLNPSDLGKMMNVTATAAITIPANRLAPGLNCAILAGSGATVTITAGAGLTLTDPGSKATLSTNGNIATIFMRTTTEAVLF